METGLLTAVLGLGLASATAATAQVNRSTITALCQQQGELGAAITRARDNGVSRAKAVQTIQKHSTTSERDEALLALVHRIYDTGRTLTPLMVQGQTEANCVEMMRVPPTPFPVCAKLGHLALDVAEARNRGESRDAIEDVVKWRFVDFRQAHWHTLTTSVKGMVSEVSFFLSDIYNHPDRSPAQLRQEWQYNCTQALQ